MTIPRLTDDQLAQLRKVDSPTVANVIELFDVQSRIAGYTNHTLKAVYPELPPTVGYAVTSTFRSAYVPPGGDAYGGMPQLLKDAETVPAPRLIVFQDLDEIPRAATYGELMVSSFQKFGFDGLITSGAGRDIEQVRRLKFPCWTSSMIVSHGYCSILASNVPVCVGGLDVRPGDLLHADGNGIVNIPHAIAAGVAELCDPFIKAEQILLDYLQTSSPTQAGYARAIGEMRQALGKLRERAKAMVK